MMGQSIRTSKSARPGTISTAHAGNSIRNQTTREPVYSMRANAHGINDLGDTYIEVDLTEQYMWYYQNGNIIFQSEIVSGLLGDPDRKTPPGIFTLNSKSSPSVLRGEMTANGTYSYEQPVTYWMPFNGGIGFHDADWQPYFGGDRYLTGVLMDASIFPRKMPGSFTALFSMMSR